jgi:hypothetical protein
MNKIGRILTELGIIILFMISFKFMIIVFGLEITTISGLSVIIARLIMKDILKKE